MQVYATGALKKISYSDSTPDVTFAYVDPWGATYWRMGKATKIIDGAGQRWLYYPKNDLQHQWEWFSWGHYGYNSGGGRGLWRSYDSLGRPTRTRVGWSNDFDEALEVRYYYDGGTGRISNIAGHRPMKVWRKFAYTYRAGSDLVSAVTGVGFNFQRSTVHQGWRDLVDYVETSWNGSSRGSFSYSYDSAAQNINRVTGGSIASQRGASALDDDYELNAKGEVIGADADNAIWNGSSWVASLKDWTFDPQGNRETEKTSGVLTTDYVVNGLNQYSWAGTTHLYDLDGNLTDDGVWTYDYDAENRLISATKKDYTLFLDYTYDYAGRRVGKTERNYMGQLIEDQRIIYDGWNPVVEVDATQGGAAYPTDRVYAWGLDITGTLHGGGGVGGLLLTTDGSNHQIPIYDANGNVQGLIDSSSGGLEAVYSYNAFGFLLALINPAGGSLAQDNPIRFASKYYDSETGLYQYNHRMYSPKLGRFITRDPIGEYGGLNLYTYCRNGPVDDWDYLGLEPFTVAAAIWFVVDTAWQYALADFFSGLFGGGSEPDTTYVTNTATWRAKERYTETFGRLGDPIPLRHGPKFEGYRNGFDRQGRKSDHKRTPDISQALREILEQNLKTLERYKSAHELAIIKIRGLKDSGETVTSADYTFIYLEILRENKIKMTPQFPIDTGLLDPAAIIGDSLWRHKVDKMDEIRNHRELLIPTIDDIETPGDVEHFRMKTLENQRMLTDEELEAEYREFLVDPENFYSKQVESLEFAKKQIERKIREL